MFTVEELVTQYEAYSDKELYDIHKNIEGYSLEAKEALEKVIMKRGGLESLLARLKDEQRVEIEKTRLIAEVGMLTRKGVDASFIRSTMQSAILMPQQVSKIIDDTYRQVKLEMDDQKVKPWTVIGSLIGTALATIIGGALWGLRLIYGPPETEIRIHLILLFGLVLVCYGIIRLLARQSRKNIVVLIGIVLSVVLSITIGMKLYEVIGPR